MSKNAIYERAISLMKESKTLSLSIIDDKGYPRIYPMEKVTSVDLSRVIFITKKDSNKVRSLKRNNKCCVEVHTEDDMVSLSGTIEIEENEKRMKQALPEAYIKRVENSGIQKYCMLIFHSHNAMLYIDNKLEHVEIE